MRVSLPMTTVGRTVAGFISTGTLPAAYPRRKARSGLILSPPTTPRIPSVPKYFRAVVIDTMHPLLPARPSARHAKLPHHVRAQPPPHDPLPPACPPGYPPADPVQPGRSPVRSWIYGTDQ